MHTSILNIHNTVGEKEATEWSSSTEKKSVSKTKEAKTPAKRPKRVLKPNYRKDLTKILKKNLLKQNFIAKDGDSVRIRRRRSGRDVERR